jgi:hypothetical protein
MTNAHPKSVPRRSVAQAVARTLSNITQTARDAAKPRPFMTARAHHPSAGAQTEDRADAERRDAHVSGAVHRLVSLARAG